MIVTKRGRDKKENQSEVWFRKKERGYRKSETKINKEREKREREREREREKER